MSTGFTRNFDAKVDPNSGRFDEDRVERAIPRFWIEDVYNKATDSLDQVEMIEIRVPGETKNVWAGRVRDEHRRRFGRLYNAFKNCEDAPVDGTPLSKLPGINHDLLGHLRYLGFASIEDLAKASDAAIGELMGGFTWRKKAQLYVSEQRKGIDEKDAIIAKQSDALEKLQEQMAALTARMEEQATKRKAGRPKKSEQAAA